MGILMFVFVVLFFLAWANFADEWDKTNELLERIAVALEKRPQE